MSSTLHHRLSTAVLKTRAAIRSQFQRLWVHTWPSAPSPPHIRTLSSIPLSLPIQSVYAWRDQEEIHVYRIATLKGEKALYEAVEKALKQVWPQVMEYAAQNSVTGGIWAQIRCSFHHSGSTSSCSFSPHATIHLYDDTLKHIGGVHAPKNPEEDATFRGGLQKVSYHGEKSERNTLHSTLVSPHSVSGL